MNLGREFLFLRVLKILCLIFEELDRLVACLEVFFGRFADRDRVF